MRDGKASDFTVTVDGVGAFVFGRKSVRDQIGIEAEYARLSEGVGKPTAFGHVIMSAISELKIMTVLAPAGWDPEAADGDDSASYETLFRVSEAYRKAVKTFRDGADKVGATAG